MKQDYNPFKGELEHILNHVDEALDYDHKNKLIETAVEIVVGVTLRLEIPTHNCIVGDTITIYDNVTYNGTYTITNVVDADFFDVSLV